MIQEVNSVHVLKRPVAIWYIENGNDFINVTELKWNCLWF